MERKEILQQIQVGLDQMKKWDINKYQANAEVIHQLNPAFGFNKNYNPDSLSNFRGVTSISMHGANHLRVKTLPRGYAGDEKYYNTDDMSNEQLQAVLKMINTLCEKEINARKQYAANPLITEIVPNIRAWAEKCAKAAGPQYSAFVSLGKRAYDREKYHAIVVFENNDQIGSISVRQDENGRFTYNERTPLGGEWMSDEQLDVKDIMRPLRDSIASITGKTIDLDTTPSQKQLLDDIRKRNHQWTENGLTLDLLVKRGQTKVPESWKINFQHQFTDDARVLVKMTGKQADVDNSPVYVIASGTYNPDKLNEEFSMEGTGEQVNLLMALARTDMVDEIDYHDTEKMGRWIMVDAAPIYGKWLHNMNQSFLFSPIRNIRYEQHPSLEGNNESENCLHASLYGGVQDGKNHISSNDRRLLEKIAHWPQYAFIEQMVAHKTFKDILQKNEETNRRITDITVSIIGKQPFIRCSIDGVQQMRQPITPEQFRIYDRSPDKQMTGIALAATAYEGELRQSQSKGMKR